MADDAYSIPTPAVQGGGPGNALKAIPLPNRRAILGTALAASAAAALPVIAPREALASDKLWAEIAEFCQFCGPDGALAVRRARLAGMNPDDFSGVYRLGRGFERKTTMLSFGDWQSGDEWFQVTADEFMRVRHE